MNISDFEKIRQLLSLPKKIAVTTHYNPDGDAIGSALGVYLILKRMGHQVQVIVPNQFPEFLKWMPGVDKIEIYTQDKNNIIENFLAEADIIFCLDYNAPNRIDKLENNLREATGLKILIDHHPQPSIESFDFLLSDITSSSTAELLYGFFVEAGFESLMNKEFADCIYTGIITDTGSMSYSCNSAATYRVIAKLIELGAVPQMLHRLIYDTFSENRIRLLGYSLSEKMKVLPEYHAAYITLSIDEFKRFSYKVGDTEGIVNYPLSIKEINLSVFLTERNDIIRLSFRSKGKFSVNHFARNHFDGGGHLNAAGGKSFTNMEETIKNLLAVLPQYKNELNFQ